MSVMLLDLMNITKQATVDRLDTNDSYNSLKNWMILSSNILINIILNTKKERCKSLIVTI